MKYSSIILIALMIIISSCGKDQEVVEQPFDFSGTYDAEFNCSGEASGDNGELFTMVIEKAEVEGTYTVDFSDEVIFNAVQMENTLMIERQTINEDLGFDVITMEGEIKRIGTEITVDVSFSVDGSEESECNFPIVKL